MVVRAVAVKDKIDFFGCHLSQLRDVFPLTQFHGAQGVILLLPCTFSCVIPLLLPQVYKRGDLVLF